MKFPVESSGIARSAGTADAPPADGMRVAAQSTPDPGLDPDEPRDVRLAMDVLDGAARRTGATILVVTPDRA